MLLFLAPLITYFLFFLLVFEVINVSATRRATGNVFKRSPTLSNIVFGQDNEMDEILICSSKKQKRRKKYKHKRLNLDDHIDMCNETDGFERRYHMSYDSFKRLVKILNIKVDEQKSRNSTGGEDPISSSMIVAMGLRFMGGEKIKSIADIYHTSLRSAERVLDIFLDAVESSDHPYLSTDLLPRTKNDRQRVTEEWAARSDAFGLFDGCLSAIDGWLCTVEKPSDVENPGDFFSGHYQKYGLIMLTHCQTNYLFHSVA